MPLRMCVACREMKEKTELMRAVRIKGDMPRLDRSFKAQGRGAYICRNDSCVNLAKKKRAFEKVFSCKTDYLYDDISAELSELNNNE